MLQYALTVLDAKDRRVLLITGGDENDMRKWFDVHPADDSEVYQVTISENGIKTILPDMDWVKAREFFRTVKIPSVKPRAGGEYPTTSDEIKIGWGEDEGKYYIYVKEGKAETEALFGQGFDTKQDLASSLAESVNLGLTDKLNSTLDGLTFDVRALGCSAFAEEIEDAHDAREFYMLARCFDRSVKLIAVLESMDRLEEPIRAIIIL
jgi:hypothetical protein